MKEIPLDEETIPEVTFVDQSLKLPKGCIHWRYVVTAMLFLGNFCSYAMRVALNVTIVAMVNQSVVPENLTSTAECFEEYSNVTIDIAHQEGEFVWSKSTQGIIVASFYYGYLVTQIPAGWLIYRVSAKWTCGLAIVGTALTSLVTPAAARASPWCLVGVRVVAGMVQGFVVPSAPAIVAQWAPPMERTRLLTMNCIGNYFGPVVGMPVTGLLCQYGFAGGWPSPFYVFGIMSLVWFVIWSFTVYDTPALHPRISTEEKLYIQRSQGMLGPEAINLKTTTPTPPWCDIFSSVHFWAIVVAHSFSSWGFYTLLSCLPQYMFDVLRFNIFQNSSFSGLPYIGYCTMGIISAVLADTVRKQKLMSTTNVRKVANLVGMVVPGISLLSISFIGCDRIAAVCLVFLSLGAMGITQAGFQSNHVDISPRYAGLLYGLSNTAGTVSGTLAPVVVGVLTDGEPTRHQWMNVFHICASVFAFGAVFYAIFGSAERQAWDEYGTKTHKFKSKFSYTSANITDHRNEVL